MENLNDHRYVIYARKSVDETGKEDKSVDQQLKYCRELAKKEDLNVVAEIKEEHSAKKSFSRKKFNKLLDDIESGEYDGIISWHPDRLARNMGDGGRVIEMIDDDTIADLKFCTQQFSKDANGKMLLGLAFVLSKQYSDKLSQDVLRGNKEKHLAGKAIGRVKPGYKIDEHGYYHKDENWRLLRRAWEMRIEGKQQVEICDWLNLNGYKRILKSTGESLKMNLSTLSRVFKDPFYQGYSYLNGGDPIYLPSVHEDFSAMVTEDEFLKVQRTSHVFVGTKQKEELWLKGRVWDYNYPDIIEYKPGVSKGKNNSYLHFKVDPTHKTRVPEEYRKEIKSVRALTIVQALNEAFKNMKTDYTEKEYSDFLDASKKFLEERSGEISIEISNMRRARTKAKKELQDLEIGYMKLSGSQNKKLKKTFDADSKRLEKEIKSIKLEIEALETEDDNLFPTFKLFSNTMKTLSETYSLLEGGAMLDIAELMLSNTFVNKGKVVTVQFKPPFDSLFSSDISVGWG